MNSPPNPSDTEPLGAPTHSKDYQTDVRVHCVREWMYLMHLLQYWYNAGTAYTYSGPVRQESKLMLYVFYRINAMLNPYSIFIWLHEVMVNTPWLSYYQARTQPEQCITDYESHLHVIKGLEVLQNWLRNHYLVEATAEWRHLKLYSGSLDRLPFPCSYEDQQLSNEGPFYCSRGIRPYEVKPTSENALQVANVMLEDIPPGNNHCKATEQQRVSTYLNRDENGEDLDYEDFEPQDDPANFQIGYRTLMPVPQVSDILPLQDASAPTPPPAVTLAASDVTIPMPQHSTGPGTIPGMTAHNVATAANQAPSFGRRLPVARALPMQVGTLLASASPMQVATLAASLHRTPGHMFATEEALLQGATLLCSPPARSSPPEPATPADR